MRRIFISILFISFIGACQEEKKKPAIEIKEITPNAHSYQFSDEIELKYLSDTLDLQHQIAGTQYSFIGNFKAASDNFYFRIADREPLDDSSFSSFESEFKGTNAHDYILERAKKEQIVIINEAHHKPKHRVLTKKLLQELYNEGFRYFGAEALNELDVTDLNFRKYPIGYSGFYTKEPQFGVLIREALRIGYEVFAYEGEGNGKPREINQAKKIQEFLKDKPNAKTLIHCGYQHAQEGKINSSWEKAMAGRVLELTGINPLTVNQTKYDNKFEFKYLSPLQKRIDITEPTVFVDSYNVSFEGKADTSGFDIMVFHEQNVYDNGRATWLLAGNKKWVEIDLNPIKLDYPYFLLAFKNGENITEAIPMDLLEIADSLQTAHFALSKEKYEIVAQSITKKTVSFELEVK
jgi:hypothetical protein